MDYSGGITLLKISCLLSLPQRLTELCNSISHSQTERDVGVTPFPTEIARGEYSGMATATFAPQSNGVGPPTDPVEREAWEISQYEKIIEIRDQVFAGTHPRLKLLYPDTIKDDDPDDDELLVNVQPPPPSQKSGSIAQSVQGNQNLSATVQNSRLPPRPPPSTHAYSAHTSTVAPTVGTGASGINPIFLTKSDVLLRAETQQKRQRIERALADQVKEQQRLFKQKAIDKDDLPDFDANDVFRKAHELVKPIKYADLRGANGNASASDSFDENTFYSSQMNDSTPESIDKVEPSRKTTSTQNCNFYIRGDKCPYGEQCTYAHDPTIRRGFRGPKSQLEDTIRNRADTQAPSGPRNMGQQQTAIPDSAPKQASQADRITELEAQLQALKSSQAVKPAGLSNINRRNAEEAREAQEEESVYSPPDAVPPKPSEVALGKRKEVRQQQQRRISAQMEGSLREFPHREAAVGSPLINEGRVVRNHITSPVAPQPARVSPLAVAKAPQISQGQRQQRQTNDFFREPANGTSPAQNLQRQQQASNPKKRRRGRESGEQVRNVVPRREPLSPEVRIKEEPISSPPFADPTEAWQSRLRIEDRGTIYVDEPSPRYQNQERVTYRPRVIDRPAPRYALENYRDPHPSMYEPDLRRVVSTRQAQASMAGNERYPSPQPLPARSSSQVYIPRQEQEVPRQYRSSIQPEAANYLERDLPPSPRFREVPMVMAPPPRRIVVDQHGNQFYEQEVAPMPQPRQPSAVPFVRQGPPERSFQSPGLHHSVARMPQAFDDESRYIRRGPTPPPPRYVEYVSPTHTRAPMNRDVDMFYGSEIQNRRADEARMVEHPPSHASGAYEEMRPVEGMIRVSSVRPIGHHYEGGPERASRVQSVRPEGRRVVSLGGEMVPQGSRHMSVRPEEGYVRPVEYVQPRMQYYSGPEGRG